MQSRKRVAALVTTYFPNSHADVIVTKLMRGIPIDDGLLAPRVELASLFTDQVHEQDIGRALAAEHGVPLYESIVKALTLGGTELAVDGVLLIGEHGDYAVNEKGQDMYPRRYFFEQICGVFAGSGRSVPVFIDKHFSHSWEDAQWMYDRAQELKVPLLAGSSLPLAWRTPPLENGVGTPVDEAVVLAYGPTERYGFHGLETLQCMVERRRGGESGIASVQGLRGDAVWAAAERGDWSQDLVEAALATIPGKDLQAMRTECRDPMAFLITYRDGLKATVLLLSGFLQHFAYAGRSGPSVQATQFVLQEGAPFAHFGYLLLNAEEMFLTGRPPYPAERTLLVTGALEALMDSLHAGSTLVHTPHLSIRYEPAHQVRWVPRGEAPTGGSIAPWPPLVG